MDSLNRKVRDSIAAFGNLNIEPGLQEMRKGRDTLPLNLSWVSDYDGLFTAQQAKSLATVLTDFEKKTSIEIIILTVDSTMVSRSQFDNYVTATGNKWGVGKAGKNNGIIIGICNDIRQIRISNGLGIEKVLSDAETKQIITEDFIPFFRDGKYYEGVLNGMKALMRMLETKL